MKQLFMIVAALTAFQTVFSQTKNYPTCLTTARELFGQSGTFGSPYYPINFYPNNANCAWRITSSLKIVILDFIYFDTELGIDFVSIYNGYSSSNALLYRFDGTLITPPTGITTTQKYMCVTFTSDFRNQRKGFEARYTSATGYPSCLSTTREFIGQSGVFGSPNYPGSVYRNFEDCTWRITSTSKIVILDFIYINTELDRDFVYVYDGSSSSSKLLHRFDGMPTPPPRGISTTQKYMYVRFKSDSKNEYAGFEARYTSAIGYSTISSKASSSTAGYAKMMAAVIWLLQITNSPDIFVLDNTF